MTPLLSMRDQEGSSLSSSADLRAAVVQGAPVSWMAGRGQGVANSEAGEWQFPPGVVHTEGVSGCQEKHVVHCRLRTAGEAPPACPPPPPPEVDHLLHMQLPPQQQHLLVGCLGRAAGAEQAACRGWRARQAGGSEAGCCGTAHQRARASAEEAEKPVKGSFLSSASSSRAPT
jgi:hypothetical protein